MKSIFCGAGLGLLFAALTCLWPTSARQPDCRIELLQREIDDTRLEVCRAIADAKEKVIDLPEDGDQWHTILLLRADWKSRAAERRAEAAFHSDPLLISLKHQTHWHLYTEGCVEFRKFRALVDVTPCLIVERANGEVVYRESGPELGRRPHGLVKAIRREVQRHCPDGRCLPIHPVPGPHDEADADEIPAVLSEPAEPARRPGNPLPAAAVIAGGIGVGFWRKFRGAAFG